MKLALNFQVFLVVGAVDGRLRKLQFRRCGYRRQRWNKCFRGQHQRRRQRRFGG
jgi:hypothetical protein